MKAKRKQTKQGLFFQLQTKPNPIWFSLCPEKQALFRKAAKNILQSGGICLQNALHPPIFYQ